MRAAVRAAFVGFTKPFEGACRWMYGDVENLITTGFGDLIDPVSLAVVLPWLHRLTLQPATKTEIVQEWLRVKAAKALNRLGGGAYERMTTLILSDEAIASLVDQRLTMNDAYLARWFPGYVDWPADAQLGLLSMAWSMGPGFRPLFPRFSAACDALDFATAALDEVRTRPEILVCARAIQLIACCSATRLSYSRRGLIPTCFTGPQRFSPRLHQLPDSLLQVDLELPYPLARHSYLFADLLETELVVGVGE